MLRFNHFTAMHCVSVSNSSDYRDESVIPVWDLYPFLMDAGPEVLYTQICELKCSVLV